MTEVAFKTCTARLPNRIPVNYLNQAPVCASDCACQAGTRRKYNGNPSQTASAQSKPQKWLQGNSPDNLKIPEFPPLEIFRKRVWILALENDAEAIS